MGPISIIESNFWLRTGPLKTLDVLSVLFLMVFSFFLFFLHYNFWALWALHFHLACVFFFLSSFLQGKTGGKKWKTQPTGTVLHLEGKKANFFFPILFSILKYDNFSLNPSPVSEYPKGHFFKKWRRFPIGISQWEYSNTHISVP